MIFLKVEFTKLGFRVRLICIVIHRDRFDTFQITAKEVPFKDLTSFGETHGYGSLYHNAAGLVFLSVIVFAALMFTGDNVAMQVCQYQKDRDEQARREFPCVVSIDFLRISTTEGSKAQVVKFLSVHQYLCDTSCGRRRLSTTIQLFTILHTFSGRRSLLTAIQIFAIGNTSCGRRRLVIAIQLFTILHTCFVLIPVSRHNASCYAKIENDLRYTQQTSYNTTFTETETGTDVTATGERP